jgi:hypothetical protein
MSINAVMIAPTDKILIPSSDINPYIHYMTSYIYLQKASYKFFLKTNDIDNIFVKTLLNIYDVNNKNPIPVSQNNNTTSKWVNINQSRFYKIEIYMAITSGSVADTEYSFEILASDKEIDEKELDNITFATKDYEYVERSPKDTYSNMKEFIYDVDNVDLFAPIYNTIFKGMNYSPTKNVSFLTDMESRITEIRNYFLGSSTTENKKSKYYDALAKLELDKVNTIKTNSEILLIDSLLNKDISKGESLANLNLQSKLKITTGPTINSVSAHTAFNTHPDILKQYITYEQSSTSEKASLRGVDKTFNMISHANRSIYVQVF